LAREALGWAPSLDFDQLVERMVLAEMQRTAH
jgi:GDP-D-mannose dehydratase